MPSHVLREGHGARPGEAPGTLPKFCGLEYRCVALPSSGEAPSTKESVMGRRAHAGAPGDILGDPLSGFTPLSPTSLMSALLVSTARACVGLRHWGRRNGG